MDGSWQNVTAKRARSTSPPTTSSTSSNATAKRRDGRQDRQNKFDLLRQNRFDLLIDEQETDMVEKQQQVQEEQQQTQKEQAQRPPSPPPIILPHVEDFDKMIKAIQTVINNDFHYKLTNNNEIRLMVHNIQCYRKLINNLNEAKVQYHTYQLKQERSYRVVLKGLHYTTDTTTIKAELIELGHDVRFVRNVTSRISKQNLNMFFVDLKPKLNNKDIFNIKYIDRAVVTFEPVKKTDDMVQCFRCQEFGHTQNYCKKPYRCVKCSQNHQTNQCEKPNESPPKCVHCALEHTANYKGCTIYQERLLSHP